MGFDIIEIKLVIFIILMSLNEVRPHTEFRIILAGRGRVPGGQDIKVNLRSSVSAPVTAHFGADLVLTSCMYVLGRFEK